MKTVQIKDKPDLSLFIPQLSLLDSLSVFKGVLASFDVKDGGTEQWPVLLGEQLKSMLVDCRTVCLTL